MRTDEARQGRAARALPIMLVMSAFAASLTG